MKKSVLIVHPNGFSFGKISECENCNTIALEGNESPVFCEPLKKLSKAMGKDLSKLERFEVNELPEHTCNNDGKCFCSECHPIED